MLLMTLFGKIQKDSLGRRRFIRKNTYWTDKVCMPVKKSSSKKIFIHDFNNRGFYSRSRKFGS